MLCGCLSGPGVTVTGEAGAPRLTTPPPDPLSLVVIYSPEHGGPQPAITTLDGQLPTDFTLHVPFPPRGAFEDKDDYSIAAGQLFFLQGSLSDPHDGFGKELVQQAGYYFIYLSDTPASGKAFGQSGMHEGWNLLRFAKPTCADATRDNSGRIVSWPAKYDVLPVETPLAVELLPPNTAMPWDAPFDCPE
jgi:hypothetical protein